MIILVKNSNLLKLIKASVKTQFKWTTFLLNNKTTSIKDFMSQVYLILHFKKI